MSTTTTPSRLGRGIDVPGIDTRAHPDKHATALSYAGCLTPPQSAHESRRGSLAYGLLTDSGYQTHTHIGTFSQPTTPVHQMSQGSNAFTHHWPEHVTDQTYGLHAHSGSICQSPVDGQELHAALQHATAFDAQHEFATTTYAGSAESQSIPWDSQLRINARADWHFGEQTPHTLSSNSAGLGLRSPLFQTQHATSPNAEAQGHVFHHTAHSFDGLPTAVNSNVGDYDPVSSSLYGQAQHTVVPSQLSPVDEWPMQGCSDYNSPLNSDGMTGSFASTNTSYSSFDCVAPCSPDEAYGYSGDEEWVNVREERLNATSTFLLQGHRPLEPARRLPIRSRKRSAKRGKYRQPRERLESDHVICDLEGKVCGAHVNEYGKVVLLEERTSLRKPHICKHPVQRKGNWVDCDAAFERSEHLKRHEKSHGEERPFKCFLPDCKHVKGIGRGDNAGDHFKTHLRGPRKGQRNRHFEWPEVKANILATFLEEKVAAKLITNIERWIRTRQPDRIGPNGEVLKGEEGWEQQRFLTRASE